eukprot:4354634-Amphidinium_carterae.1
MIFPCLALPLKQKQYTRITKLHYSTWGQEPHCCEGYTTPVIPGTGRTEDVHNLKSPAANEFLSQTPSCVAFMGQARDFCGRMLVRVLQASLLSACTETTYERVHTFPQNLPKRGEDWSDG